MLSICTCCSTWGASLLFVCARCSAWGSSMRAWNSIRSLARAASLSFISIRNTQRHKIVTQVTPAYRFTWHRKQTIRIAVHGLDKKAIIIMIMLAYFYGPNYTGMKVNKSSTLYDWRSHWQCTVRGTDGGWALQFYRRHADPSTKHLFWLKVRSHCTWFMVMKQDETGQWNTLKHHETNIAIKHLETPWSRAMKHRGKAWNSNETAWNSKETAMK